MNQRTESNNQENLKGQKQDAVRRLFSRVLSYKKWLAVAMCAMVVTAGSSSLIALLVGQLSLRLSVPTFCRKSLKIFCINFVPSYFLEFSVGLLAHIKGATRERWCLYL